jgi:diguanylate cyclase (GGDEF)-like protein/PAS domain S-box-containing protein
VPASNLSTFFELLPIGAYRIGLDGRLFCANTALLQLNGYTSEAELRADVGDFVPDQYLDPTRRKEFQLLLERDGQVKSFVSEMVGLKSKARFWVREHAHLVRDAHGNALFYEGTLEDISEEREALAQRDRSETLLRNVLQSIPDPIWLKDLRGNYLTCNMAFAANLGVQPADVQGTCDTDWVDETTAAQYLKTDHDAMEAGRPLRFEEGYGKPGVANSDLHELMKTPMRDSHGRVMGILGMARNIQAHKDIEARLRATQAELQATLNALPDLLIEVNAEGRIRTVHAPEEPNLVAPGVAQPGELQWDLLPDAAAQSFNSALQETKHSGKSNGHQYSLDLASGTQWFELSVVRKPTEPEEEERFIAIVRNISQRKSAEQAFEKLAFQDSLTGLPNLRLFNDRLQSAVTASHREQSYGALMFLDLDHFKPLNDTYGHDVGDLLLKEVGARLQQCMRAVDTVARLGGDEFVALIQGLSAEAGEARQHAAALGQKIIDRLNEPYVLNSIQHTISLSLGITLFLGQSIAPNALLKQADVAMYRAKATGRNTLCFYGEHF